MRTTRFVWVVLGVFFALATLHVGLVWYQLGVPHPAEDWVHETETVKRNLARAIQERKLVILGGSNALFNYEAELIERRLGIPTVNMGIHGGLPLWYLLPDAQSYLRDGDQVLLSIDYAQYQRRSRYDTWFLNQILTWRPDYFLKAEVLEKLRIAAAIPFPRLLSGALLRLLGRQGVGEIHSVPRSESEIIQRYRHEEDREQEVYSMHNVSHKGDILKFGVGSIGDEEYGMRGSFFHSAETWQALRDFSENCRSKGVKLWIIWPAVVGSARLDSESESLHPHLAEIRRRLKEMGIEVLGDPRDVQYPRELFSDHASHLNAEGRRLRTLQLIADLQKAAL